MKFAPQFKVDNREFLAALRQGAAKTSKALPFYINEKMFYVLQDAFHGTPKTTRARIEHELGVTSYNISTKKRGGFRKWTQQGKVAQANIGTKLIYQIINARLGRAGKKGLHGAAMRAASVKFLAKRFRSIGTLRMGWLHALLTFGKAIGKFIRMSDIDGNKRIKGKGQARIAKPGWNPVAEMYYNVNAFEQPSHRNYIHPHVVKALEKAFAKQARGILDYLAKKLQPIYDEIDGRKAPRDTRQLTDVVKGMGIGPK